MAHVKSAEKSILLKERRPPLGPPEKTYGPGRKVIHAICVAIFVALPFTNVMRFDIPRSRFYIAGMELWISEFSIIFFSMMFLMFLLAASAIVYGRIYCSYACPQMIFSEASVRLERWLEQQADRRLKGLGKGLRKLAARAAWLGLLTLASIALAFVFTAYFVEPRDLFNRLMHADLVTAGGITGATVTLITLLDFTLLRHRFCTTICPYGYLQSLLQDKHSLLVTFKDPGQVCIECGKCVRVCEMGIDIRNSPYQMECVHCGDCVDACEDVLRRVGHPGLIGYAWGDGTVKGAKEPFWLRWGIRDAKRVVILLVALAYLAALGVALHLRRPVMVRITPDRTQLFTRLEDGRYANKVRLNLANRSSKPASVQVWVEGLPQGEVALQPNPVPLAPGEARELVFELRAPVWAGSSDVNPVKVMAQSSDQGTPEVLECGFILPYRP